MAGKDMRAVVQSGLSGLMRDTESREELRVLAEAGALISIRPNPWGVS